MKTAETRSLSHKVTKLLSSIILVYPVAQSGKLASVDFVELSCGSSEDGLLSLPRPVDLRGQSTVNIVV